MSAATPPGSPPAAPSAPSASPATPAPAGQPPAAAPPAAPPQPPAAPAPAAPEPPAPGQQPDPAWLAARLEQAKRAALKGAGFETAEEAAAAKARLTELEDEKRSEKEKLEARLKELEAPAAQAATLQKRVEAWALQQLATLTPEQQASVKALAGDDASKQLEVIEALKPTWAAPPAPPAEPAAPANTGTPPAARPPVAPATTTHTQPAPGGTAAPAESHLARLEAIRQHNPVEAAIYLQEHSAAIAQEREARRKSGG